MARNQKKRGRIAELLGSESRQTEWCIVKTMCFDLSPRKCYLSESVELLLLLGLEKG